MTILEKISEAFGKEPVARRDQIKRLEQLPKDQVRKEFSLLLYDHGIHRASEFVRSEMSRPDSPFQGISAHLFFHEIVCMTFWLMDKKITGGEKELSAELHELYCRGFTVPDGCSKDRDVMEKKGREYEETWNEFTGHFDEFGLCVVNNIFGHEPSARTRERTFLIIKYADKASDSFSSLKKAWKRISISSEIRQET